MYSLSLHKMKVALFKHNTIVLSACGSHKVKLNVILFIDLKKKTVCWLDDLVMLPCSS